MSEANITQEASRKAIFILDYNYILYNETNADKTASRLQTLEHITVVDIWM